MKIDTILTPAELPALAGRDWRGTACVVFDILRATSTFVTALHHGAQAIIPVSDIRAAVAWQQRRPEMLLAGERAGVRISAAQTGGTEFDLGNSPREFTAEKVRGRRIVATTTNGTRALRAVANAPTVLAAAFLNLSATAEFLLTDPPVEIVLVCAGTGENTALEDVLAAGALVDLLVAGRKIQPDCTDAALVAWRTFAQLKADLPAALAGSQNGRRLRAMPELCADVDFCAQRDIFPVVAAMTAAGELRRWPALAEK